MPLIQHNDVVKKLLAKGSHYSRRDRVRQRRPPGGSDTCTANASELGSKVIAVGVVSVVDQLSRLTAPASGLDHLPPDPSRFRARGEVESSSTRPARLF